MKKISIFLFIFTSIALSTSLAACSAQQAQVTATSEVTVTSLPPTATIIPTPTLHPQFIEVQEQIAASGETFTLLSDGTIQQTTSKGTIIVPGLSVDKNGAITLQGDSSQVIINPEDVSFDDENGVNVKGYTLDEANGEWVTTELTSEEQLADDMKLLKLSGTPETTAEGDMILKDNAGKTIYRNGWMGDRIENVIAEAGICKPTDYVVDPNGEFSNSTLPVQKQALINYAIGLVKKIGYSDSFQVVNPGPLIGEDGVLRYDILRIPLRNTSQCWLIFISPNDPNGSINFVTFETNEGVVGLPLSQ